METYEELAAMVEGMRADAEKFFLSGNKSAGTRLRKQLQDLRTAAKSLRDEVQDAKKTEDK